MKRWQIIFGIVLIILGLFALLEAVFNIRLSQFIFPLLLIGAGIFLILRPTMAGENVDVQIPVIGDQRKTGNWTLSDHEVWWFVGSNRYDLSDSVFTKDEHTIRIIGFAVDVTIILPDEIGLLCCSNSIISEFKGFDSKEEQFFSTFETMSPNYLSADKKVRLEIYGFVSEIKVKPSRV